MIHGTARYANKLFAVAIALAFALTAVFLVTPTAQARADEGAGELAIAQLSTEADDVDYFFSLEGAPYGGSYGICGTPGEKLTLKASVKFYDQNNNGKETAVNGVTFKWTKVNKKLKATAKGNTLSIKKLPKAGSYKFTVTAYEEDGSKLLTQTYTIVVKKKPAVKIGFHILDPKKGHVPAKKANRGQQVMFNMKNASFAWDNNTKKPFYTWTVKDVNSGKTVTWTSKKNGFVKTAFVQGGSIGGGNGPTFGGAFTETGTFKITGKVFHSNKAIATASKTVKILYL